MTHNEVRWFPDLCLLPDKQDINRNEPNFHTHSITEKKRRKNANNQGKSGAFMKEWKQQAVKPYKNNSESEEGWGLDKGSQERNHFQYGERKEP